jgi:protein-S-isoprenylcysteine O-methyltransferase Ste14
VTKVYHYIARALVILMFGLLFLVGNVNSKAVWYAGWVLWGISITLLAMPFIIFPRRGGVKKGKNALHTTALVDTGIYAVVRHPQYLGWFLMYPAIILFGQHWLFIPLGTAGMVCVVLFTRREDQNLIEKFGDDYVRYMQRVPGMNIFGGIIRLIRRKAKAQDSRVDQGESS